MTDARTTYLLDRLAATVLTLALNARRGYRYDAAVASVAPLIVTNDETATHESEAVANAIAAFVEERIGQRDARVFGRLREVESDDMATAKALDDLTLRLEAVEEQNNEWHQQVKRLGHRCAALEGQLLRERHLVALRLEALERRHDDDVMLAYETGYTNSSEAQDHGGTEAARSGREQSPPAGAASVCPPLRFPKEHQAYQEARLPAPAVELYAEWRAQYDATHPNQEKP